MTQDRALELMKTDANIFLTGQPGAGKTYLTNRYLSWLADNGKTAVITASTGIASTHVGGQTLHSFAGVRDDGKLTADDIDEILGNSWTIDRLRGCKVLVIDEVSMVSKNLINIVSVLLKKAKGNDHPFGGTKIVAVGDFFQLPPVKGDYAFEASAWQDAEFKVCYLHEQHRQSEPVYLDILTGIRKGVLTEEQKQVIRDRLVDDVSDLGVLTRLETHNSKVDEINKLQLSRLGTEQKMFKMKSEGKEFAVAKLQKFCMSPEKLVLKIGARVMFTKNDAENFEWVNGSQGVVVGFVDHNGHPGVKVELISGKEVIATSATWELATGYGRYKVVEGSISQIPLRLGYAITIHKSQGMTLDRAVINTTRAFAPGQGYVAVSRVRSLDGLYFQGQLTKGMMMVDKAVQAMDEEFLKQSAENE